MFVRRAVQLKLLEEQYLSYGNNLVILYGRKGIGKTTLITEFLKDKPHAFYYEGTECSDKLQLSWLNRQAVVQSGDLPESADVPNYLSVLSKVIGDGREKKVIVLDEFHYIIKNSPDFTEAFRLLGDKDRPVMFLLCSSSIRWVENEMIEDLGGMASYITAYLKLKEFTFVDFVNYFPKSPVDTCIHSNAILGGIPEYLREWREDQTVSENIQNIILDKNSRLFMQTQQFLKLELRETAVYNTILSALAQGNRKLNDLHAQTGFSRAKIIVYLKNLMELDLIEKLIPLNEEGKENVQKGLYRIKDHYFAFWYRFVFPNLSELMLGKTAEVFEEQIKPYLNNYVQEYFADVCTEYLKLMNQHQRLPEKYTWWDRWYGKSGTIDILAQGENGKTLVGKCIWEDRNAETSDYDNLISLTAQAGKQADCCYLFSKSGFSRSLREIAAEAGTVILVGLDEF